MVLQKRKMVVGLAALAAAFALTGCAPPGYNGGNTGGGTVQPADGQDDASADPQDDSTDPSAGDEQAGDGQSEGKESGDVSADDATEELNAAKVKRMGETVQNEDGFVLYRFDDDVSKGTPKSNCNEGCAKTWPPALTNDGKPKLNGVDPELVGTITRDDGTKQITLRGWPLYTYIGDKVAGTWKGQNVSGKWFVIKPDGTKNLTCLPAKSKPVAPPADESDSDDDASTGSGGAGGDFSY